MRWAIVGAYNLDSAEYHLHDSLTYLGHDVKCLDFPFKRGKAVQYWLRRLSEKYDAHNAQKLADEILDYNPDILIVVYRIIHPLLVRIVKEKRPDIIAIQINPDAIVTLEQQQIIASPFDFYFTKEPFMERFLRNKAGLNAYYVPESHNPRLHFPPDVNRKDLEARMDVDVLFFGNMYPYRVRIIEQLLKHGVRVKLHGAAGKYFPVKLLPYFSQRMITGLDKTTEVYGARIVFNCFHYSEIEAVNCKYFEIAGIEGFQICDYTTCIEEYTKVPAKAYTFSHINEAIDLIHHYLPRQEERFELARQQRQHFLANHTYEHRMEQIMQIIDADLQKQKDP